MLTEEQTAWKIDVARLLGIALTDGPSGAPQGDGEGQAYSANTAATLGPDELGARNADRKIAPEIFSAFAADLQGQQEEFLKDASRFVAARDALAKSRAQIKEATERLASLEAQLDADVNGQSDAGKKNAARTSSFAAWKEAGFWYEIMRYKDPTSGKDLVEYRSYGHGVGEFVRVVAAQEAFDKDIARQKNEIEATKARISELNREAATATSECVRESLPAVDAPSNNPEREVILRLFRGAETWNEPPPPNEAEARARLKSLAEMERAIGAWINRRSEQSLPPPRDGMHMAEVVQAEHRKIVQQSIREAWASPPVAGLDTLDDETRRKMEKIWSELLTDSGPFGVITSDGASAILAEVEKIEKEREESSESGSETEDDSGDEGADENGDWKEDEGGDGNGTESGDESGDEGADENGDGNGDESGHGNGTESGDENGTESGDEGGDEKGDEGGDERGDEGSDQTGDESSDDSVEPPPPTRDRRRAERLLYIYKEKGKIPDLAEFQVDTLANLARLMAIPSGRDILSAIAKVAEEKGRYVDVLPVRRNPKAAATQKLDAVGTNTSGGPMPHTITPGPGTSCTIRFPKGARDGDFLAGMESGNPVVALTSVLMGHELLHALHYLTGTARGTVKSALEAAGLDQIWTDFEEYWTIKAGDISEMTLRQDYGLSAERFGHGVRAPSPDLAEAAGAIVDASRAVEAEGREAILNALQSRGFSAASIAGMTDATRLALYRNEKAAGPLPEGWNPASLSADTIVRIAAGALPYRLDELGWTPFGLPYEATDVDPSLGFPRSLRSITEARVYHPSSPKGRAFAALGGMSAINALEELKKKKGFDFGTRSDTSWPANLDTLVKANTETAKTALTNGTVLATFATLSERIDEMMRD